MIVVVTGGRNYSDGKRVYAELGDLKDIQLVIHGGAKGADYLADLWAKNNEVDSLRVAAKWISGGKSAGPCRNQRMLEIARSMSDELLLLAFPGADGTRDCVRRAREMGIPVFEVKYPNTRVVSERSQSEES